MTRADFEAIGGTVASIRRNPADTRFLAELPHQGGTIRYRAATATSAIEGVMKEYERRDG